MSLTELRLRQRWRLRSAAPARFSLWPMLPTNLLLVDWGRIIAHAMQENHATHGDHNL